MFVEECLDTEPSEKVCEKLLQPIRLKKIQCLVSTDKNTITVRKIKAVDFLESTAAETEKQVLKETGANFYTKRKVIL